MALSTKLMMRQGQSLVMTPQLLQAIKLLQFSGVELNAFVEEELERNPLLERAEEQPDPELQAAAPASDDYGVDDGDTPEPYDVREGDWASGLIETDQAAIEDNLGSGVENAIEADRAPTPGEVATSGEMSDYSATSWTGAPGGVSEGEAPNLEAYVAARRTLAEHLSEQLAVAVVDPADRMIGYAIIDSLDENGYLHESLADLADRLGIGLPRAEAVLQVIQTFEPSGVGARNLAECLAIQLREKDRFDPAMQAMVANLPLLAKRDFAALKKLCGVDDEDIAEMVREIRKLDPKPGRAYGDAHVQPVIPDVTVRPAPDGSWHVELNPEGLPRVLVNQSYAARVSGLTGSAADRSFVSNCLQTANWLTKSLEQRARTILKVATEIVRQQDAFFAHGVEQLRPLNLKTIADAIGMHESTVSRVTSNKYLASPRGLFEFKYFFTASIAAGAGAEAHSAESVRYRIKQMIDQESPDQILSDDAIVARLKAANVVIARRTVAKYRESLRIPSSVDRRREKTAMQS
jgi:RNA polymerase sigma-54 factor